jgi:hypothetical protein
MAEPSMVVAALGFCGAVFGHFVGQTLARRAARKLPKTQERAKVYEALATRLCKMHQSRQIHSAASDAEDAELCTLLVSLAVYGESNVVVAVSEALKQCREQERRLSADELVKVLKAMRASLRTGTGDDLMLALPILIGSGHAPNAQLVQAEPRGLVA